MGVKNLLLASLDEAAKHIQRARERVNVDRVATEDVLWLGEVLKDCARAQTSIAEIIEEARFGLVTTSASRYDFETIPDKSVTSGPTPGVRYRIRYIASDNAIAHCYDKANAGFVVDALNASGVRYIVDALNASGVRYMDFMPSRYDMTTSASRYDFETIPDKSVTSGPTPGVRYRIRDIASDNAIAHCYDKANAGFVVDALNASGVRYMDFMRNATSSGENKR